MKKDYKAIATVTDGEREWTWLFIAYIRPSKKLMTEFPVLRHMATTS